MKHSKPHLPFSSSRSHGIPINRDLVGTVCNCADAVRLKTAPTVPDKSGSKPRGKSVYLFLEFTIICVLLYHKACDTMDIIPILVKDNALLKRKT